MVGKRRSEKHLMPRLYVKRGKRLDTYYTILGGRYHGLGNERAAAERQLRDLIEGRPVAGTIAEMVERYIAHIERERDAGVKTALAERTVGEYAEALRTRLVPVFGRMRPQDFRPTHAAQYLAKMAEKDRGTRANREIAALSSAFAYAMRLGIVERNPCHGVRRNPERPRTRRPKIAELNTLLELARAKGTGSYMVALIAAMVAITGRRRAEIMRLTLGAITPAGLVGDEVKAKRGQPTRSFEVEWSPILRQIVDQARTLERPATSVYLFASRRGGPYSDSGFKAMWNRLMAEFVAAGGEHFTAHDLRALFVTEKLERGEDPKTHADPATTHRVYARSKVVKVKPLA